MLAEAAECLFALMLLTRCQCALCSPSDASLQQEDIAPPTPEPRPPGKGEEEEKEDAAKEWGW